jgi:8-oxo-dGTP diphosphatase
MLNVVCAIILKDNKILVTQRNANMKLPFKWEFPGGKIEENESEQECIKREIKEELNIEIDDLKKITNSIYDYGSFEINLIPFVANYVSGEIQLAEHRDYKWLDKTELLQMDWAEADLPIVNDFLKLYL